MLLLSHLSRIACLALVANVACAAEPLVEITPFGAYRAGGQFLDDNRAKLELDSSTGWGLAFNWQAAEQGTQYEVFYSRQSTATDAATPLNMKIEYLHIGGTTVVGELGSRVEPFAVGGIGITRFAPQAIGEETRGSLNLGGGVRIPLAAHVRLRLEARGYLTWLGGSADVFCAGGCGIAAKSKTFFQYEAVAGVSVGF